MDGYRAPKQDDEAPAWDTWQRNRLDARRDRERAQLLEVFALRLPVREPDVHEDRAVSPPGSLKQALETLWQAS